MLIINDFYDVFIFVSFFIGLIRFKYFSSEIRFVFYFVAFSVFTELFTEIYKAVVERNTMPIGHFYIPISFLLLGLFYRSALKNYINQKVLNGIIVTFLFFSLINVLFIQSLFEFANITGALSAIILCVFSILLFAKIMSEAKIKKLGAEPLVWINLGILFYHAANFFFYILFNYTLSISTEFARGTIYFNWMVGILFYILIIIGFILTKKTGKQTKAL
jgi:hypothetical protein